MSREPVPATDVVAYLRTWVEALGLATSDEIIGTDVKRTTHAYPLQVMNFIEKSDTMVDALCETHNLITIGRQGLFRYCNMNECIEMSLEIVPDILAGKTPIRYQRAGTWQGVGVTDEYAQRNAVAEKMEEVT